MIYKFFSKLLLIFLVAGPLIILPVKIAEAEEKASCQEVISYQDLDGDGQAEAMMLACQFSAETHDQLTIYKNTGKISVTIPWQQNITYQDETWVFDHGAKGRASLIITFMPDDSSLIAELYDDRNGDGMVSYEIKNGRVKITESQYWTVQVTAPDGWWEKDGVLNYNLHLLVDGDVEGMFMVNPYRSKLISDGQPDFDIQIYDQNHDGRPEFDKRMILTRYLQGSVGLGTQMIANWAGDEKPISGGFTLWPYLDLNHSQISGSWVVKGYQNTPPPIMFEPGSGRIEAIGEFVASRGNEHNCFYYSAIPWLAERVNQSDFESPFCFYDLANDRDGIPELQVRSSYWPPFDRAFQNGMFSDPYEQIRYSWDQYNEGSWRYAIGLVGRHLVDTQVTFPGLNVLTIPYDEFPSWVIDHTWDMAVFSEFTGKQYFTSEGNYSVSYLEDSKFAEYFTGKSETKPSPEYEPDKDFKMEWAMDYASQPNLYFSPLDHHLHLLGSTGGAWNLGDDKYLRYQNLDGDGYIDQWQYWIGDTLLQQMDQSQGSLVVSGMYQVKIKLANMPLSSFETQPPTNHDQWLKLGEQLKVNENILEVDDFSGMLDQLQGEMLTISNATLRDYRPTMTGYRFVLGLEPGFSFEGTDWLGLTNLSEGEFVVSYDKGKFTVTPITPPDLVANVGMDAGEIATQFISQQVNVNLSNQGLEDANQVLVRLGARQGSGEISWSEPQTITVLAGETTPVSFPWAPDAPGEWQLKVQAHVSDPEPDNNNTFTNEQSMIVQPAQSTTLKQEMSAFSVVAPWQVVLLLISVTMVAGLAGWVLTRSMIGQKDTQQSPNNKMDSNL